MRDPSKLEPLQEIFDKYKTDEIVGVWTDGVVETAVFTDSRDFKTVNKIMYAVADLFDIDKGEMAGGIFATKYVSEFIGEEYGYYVD